MEVVVEVSPNMKCTHSVTLHLPQVCFPSQVNHVPVCMDTDDHAFHALVADEKLNSYMKESVRRHAPKGAVSAKIVYQTAFDHGVDGEIYPSLMTTHPCTGKVTRFVATGVYEGTGLPEPKLGLAGF